MATMTRHAVGMFCWSELATSDPPGAKKFYSELFGWKPEDTPMGEGQSYTMLRKDGKEIGALYPLQKDQREQGIASNWLPYISVASADEAADKVKQAGGKVTTEPFDVMEHGRMAVCQDPTGAVFAVWQAKAHTGAALVNEIGSVCWTELITNNSSKAGAFYRKVFGWAEEPMTMPQGTYTILKNDSAQAGGMMQATPEMKLTHPYWLTYFEVADCDSSAAKAKQLGAKVMMQPTDIPNIGRFSVMTDPQGAWFAIIKMTRPN